MRESALDWESLEVFGAPRRLAFLLGGIADRQADREEVVLGPPKSVAFDAQGVPAPPAVGFARKMGVPPDELKLVPTDKGEYVAVRRLVKGKPTTEILREGASEDHRLDFLAKEHVLEGIAVPICQAHPMAGCPLEQGSRPGRI